MTRQLSGPPTPICPRCGYDQSGVVASWTDSCPLEGVCSECGLDFPWRLALGEQVLGPPWSVEHGLRLSPLRLARAFARGVFQQRLWQTFELGTSMRPRRLWILIALSLTVFHLLNVGLIAIPAIVTRALEGWSQVDPYALSTWITPYALDPEIYIGAGTTLSFPVWPITVVAACSFLVPSLAMLVFTETMSRVGVRRIHILRGVAYMSAALGPGSLAITGLMAVVVWAEGPLGLWFPGISGVVGFAVLLGWPLLQTLRWRAFVRHYLRLPHADWIAASVFVILILSIVLAMVGCFIVIGERY